MIGLEHYDSFYLQQRPGQQQLLACLVLKRDARDNDASVTGLVRNARIYFTGNCIPSPMMLQVFKTEAVVCKGGFPCNGASNQIASSSASATTSTTTAATTTCKVLLSAIEFREALRNFMCGDTYDELVCDAMKTQGNGLGFRTIHHEGKCVASLYLLRDNVMLMEQPLFGAHAKDIAMEQDIIGPNPSLFVLNVTVIRTFLGLSNDIGTVDLAFKEFHATGEQRMTLSYHRQQQQRETECTDSGNNGYIFTATCSLIPTRVS